MKETYYSKLKNQLSASLLEIESLKARHLKERKQWLRMFDRYDRFISKYNLDKLFEELR